MAVIVCHSLRIYTLILLSLSKRISLRGLIPRPLWLVIYMCQWFDSVLLRNRIIWCGTAT
jgi:hypothetical protein